MEKDKEITEVYFVASDVPSCFRLKHRPFEITAVFKGTEYLHPLHKVNRVQIYAHNGQHGEADVEWVKSQRTATKSEYKPLFDELENLIGYRLKVVDR